MSGNPGGHRKLPAEMREMFQTEGAEAFAVLCNVSTPATQGFRLLRQRSPIVILPKVGEGIQKAISRKLGC